MDLQSKWEQRIQEKFQGKKVVQIRYLTEKENESFGFDSRPIVFIFEGGSYILPMMDDEGNDAGALCTNFDDLPTIPVMR